MPKVSVVIPVYGVERYIERCARSLFDQTLDDIEYIFVDDCTKDKSIEVLKNVLKDYPKRQEQTIIVRHDINKGLPIARQTGVKLATGDYIAHCDSDDWVDNEMYRLLYEKANDESADIVICDYFKANESFKERIQGCYSTDKNKLIKDFIIERIGWSVWNKLVRTSLYRDNDLVFPNDNMGEDMALVMQIIQKTQKISYLPQPLYYYFYNPSSITHQPSTEAIYKRYTHLANNTKIVLSSLSETGLEKKFKAELLLLKWYVRRSIWFITYDSKYRFIWSQTYPEIFPAILFTKYIKLLDKIKIILTYLRLYP